MPLPTALPQYCATKPHTILQFIGSKGVLSAALWGSGDSPYYLAIRSCMLYKLGHEV